MCPGIYLNNPENMKLEMKINRIIHIALTVAALLGVTFDGAALPYDFNKKAAIDSINKELAVVTSPTDSLVLLSNLFDLHPRQKRDSLGKMIYRLALATGNSHFGLDVVRNLGNNHQKSDSLLDIDIQHAMRFEPSDDRDETVTFLRMLRNTAKVNYSTEDEKEREFHRIVRMLNSSEEKDLYECIVLLHALCLYIGDGSQGELLSKYLDRLGGMIEQLRPEAYSLRNCYYVLASMSYANNEEYNKAIEMDHKLLELLDGLEDGILGQGRKYRDYDGNRYILYTRMLSYFPLLSQKEVERYYKEAMNLVEHDESANATNSVSGCPQIYYAMYNKDYAKALELLNKYRDMPYNAPKKEKLLKYTIKCAEKLGDNETLLAASREYNDILEDIINERTREKYKELQLVYDISGMKQAHADEARMLTRKAFVWALVAAGVLLVLLVTMWMFFRHARKLSKELRDTNEALRRESENLKISQAELTAARDEARNASRLKSDFIKNMSNEVAVPLHTINEYANLIIDCSEAGYKPYLKHFSELVALNSELLTTIVNDVLNLSEIDSHTLEVSRKKENLENLLDIAADSVRHRLHDGVTLRVENTGKEVNVVTDGRRLVQILVQLLTNAAKVTRDGEIVVSYDLDIEQGKMSVVVTDDGPGISAANSERIFERFVKLDRNSQGAGIGLSVARRMAQILGGTLRLDTEYQKGGARFVLTLPID